MLRVEGLHTYYGHGHILQGVDLEVSAGRIASVLGRNGVGKTTTLRSIIGLAPPRAGHVFIADRDVAGWAPHRIVRVDRAKPHGYFFGRFPVGSSPVPDPDKARDPAHVEVEWDHEDSRVDAPPEPEIDPVRRPHDPAQEEVPPLASAPPGGIDDDRLFEAVRCQ